MPFGSLQLKNEFVRNYGNVRSCQSINDCSTNAIALQRKEKMMNRFSVLQRATWTEAGRKYFLDTNFAFANRTVTEYAPDRTNFAYLFIGRNANASLKNLISYTLNTGSNVRAEAHVHLRENIDDCAIDVKTTDLNVLGQYNLLTFNQQTGQYDSNVRDRDQNNHYLSFFTYADLIRLQNNPLYGPFCRIARFLIVYEHLNFKNHMIQLRHDFLRMLKDPTLDDPMVNSYRKALE